MQLYYLIHYDKIASFYEYETKLLFTYFIIGSHLAYNSFTISISSPCGVSE